MLQSHAPARLGPLAAAAWRQCAALLQQQQQHAGMSTAKSTFAVPEGHHSSDLSSTACHIGLGRRRDLTMRQDLRLWEGGKELSLAEVFNVSGAAARARIRAPMLRAQLHRLVCVAPCAASAAWRVCCQDARQDQWGAATRAAATAVEDASSPASAAWCTATRRQNFKTLLVGLPGGKICTEQHTPGYLQAVRASGTACVCCGQLQQPPRPPAPAWHGALR